MCKVTINNFQYDVPKGELLSDFLVDNGFSVAHICGGRGLCGKCLVIVNGESVLSCQYTIDNDITVELPCNGEVESVTGVTKSSKLSDEMCYALDIGTTTLALGLVSVDNKEVIDVATCTNPQVSFGGDVISRIDYCRENGVQRLQKALVDGINTLIDSVGGIGCDEMYVSGNTTMLHILFGENPTSLGVAPYTPVFLASQRHNGKDFGINSVKTIISLPCISAFVGADLVAGLNFADKPREGKYNLLVDLGTNAEIILFSKDEILCTSAAAGPCFEGAGINCGMSATGGAVYSFELKNNKPGFKTISDKEARGICGTGLVDIISELLENCIVDETGYMACETYNITENVYINQMDIRQYQLAKSAVYSAIIILMNIANVKFADIEGLYISGGFSSEINIENAVKTGLLPRELKEKTEPINNSSLLGTVKYAIEKNEMSEYIEKARYIDLATNSDFSDLFIENMEF